MKIYDQKKGENTIEFEFKIQEPKCFALSMGVYPNCLGGEEPELCDYGCLYEKTAETYDCL